MRKKWISGVMAASLMALMSATALAAPITGAGGQEDHAVKGTYQPGSASTTVYSVDVAWGKMEFTYTEGSSGTWDPSTHQYTGQTTGQWSCAAEDNKITVTNHSNAAVDAVLAFAATGNVTGGFYDATTGGGAVPGSKLSLATAEGTQVSQAPKEEAYLQITGGSITATGQIGTVTVTLQ